MKVTTVGKRGILFSFDELLPGYGCTTSVYVIKGSRKFFICDTYLGGRYIRQIKEHLLAYHETRSFVVFNSHYHWDHIWGNCEFAGSAILSSKLTYEYILLHGKKELAEKGDEFLARDVKLVLPNMTFTTKLIFEDEGVEFFCSPGHTADSASCYDLEDKILFVGDNVEEPRPSFDSNNDLKSYIQTLQTYLTKGAETIVMSHGGVANNQVIEKNLHYIENIMWGTSFEGENS